MNRTMCISFPRSGHHLLVRGMFTLAPDVLVYSESYKSPHNMGNCEWVNFQKDHDLDLSLEIDDELQYLVMYRAAHDAIRSWHKMLVDYEGLEQSLGDFMDEKLEFWDQWTLKWAERSSMVYEYNQLIQYPVEHVIHAVELVFPDYDYTHNIEHLERWAKCESSHPNVKK